MRTRSQTPTRRQTPSIQCPRSGARPGTAASSVSTCRPRSLRRPRWGGSREVNVVGGNHARELSRHRPPADDTFLVNCSHNPPKRPELSPRPTAHPRAPRSNCRLSPTADRGARAASQLGNTGQYLLGALQLKAETSCRVVTLPHFGQGGGWRFQESCSLIETLTSKRWPQDWHSHS